LFVEGDSILSMSLDSIRLWDKRSTAAPLPSYQGQGNNLSMEKLEHSVCVGDMNGDIHEWNYKTNTTQKYQGAKHAGAVNCIRFEPSLSVLCSCGTDGYVRVWDTKTKTIRHNLQAHAGSVHSIAPKGNKIVSCGADRCVRVWDVTSAHAMYTLLGGSLQQRAGYVEHPLRAGVSEVEVDDSRVIASMNSMLKVYNFEIYKPKQ